MLKACSTQLKKTVAEIIMLLCSVVK